MRILSRVFGDNFRTTSTALNNQNKPKSGVTSAISIASPKPEVSSKAKAAFLSLGMFYLLVSRLRCVKDS